MKIQDAIKMNKPFTREDSRYVFAVVEDRFVYNKDKDKMYRKASCVNFSVEDILAENWEEYTDDVFWDED